MDLEKVKRAGELATFITANKANIELIKSSDCLTFAAENRSDSDNVTLVPGEDTVEIINTAKEAAVAYVEKKVTEWEEELEKLFK